MNRGGSWNNNPQNCRAAYRNNWKPTNRNNNIGFRVARSSTLGRMAADEQVLALLLALPRQKRWYQPSRLVILVAALSEDLTSLFHL